MSYDWDQLDKEQPVRNTQYKTYAPNGEYMVKLESATITDNPNWKSPAVQFNWAEDDQYRYPRSVRHWLSMANDNYRRRHVRGILMACGIEKEKAQQLIDKADETKADRAKFAKAYEQIFNQVASRRPTVHIAVQDQWRDGKPVVSDKGTVYGESDFTAYEARAMERHDTKPNPLADAEEINLDESPF